MLSRACGRDYSAAGAGRSLEASEARFGGHRVAGLRLHDADTDELVDECLAPDGMVAGLRALREAGRVEQVSLGMNMVVAPQILRLLREAPEGTWDNIMLAHGWNLLCQVRSHSLAKILPESTPRVGLGNDRMGWRWWRSARRAGSASTTQGCTAPASSSAATPTSTPRVRCHPSLYYR